MNPHPVAKIFGPAVFFSLALLTLGFSVGSAQAQSHAEVMTSPRIERFDLDPPTRLVAGEAMIFRLSGSPLGSANVKIDGVKGKVALREVMTGVYEGVHTITTVDRIVIDSIVTGNLRVGDREHSMVLAQPLIEPIPPVALR